VDVCEENVSVLEKIVEKGQPLEDFELRKGLDQVR